MKKTFKSILYTFIGIILLGISSCFILSEKMPEGQEGPAAEALTDKMFDAINKEAWATMNIVQWTFVGHDYLWDKREDWLKVNWGNKEVLMDMPAWEGEVYRNGKKLNGWQRDRIFKRAYTFFCNDSFWFNAPVKARDEGTSRFLVEQEDGSEALLVKYSSGGVTPGDSYLWLLDESGQPTGWKMWVKIIPIKGTYTSWEKWTTLDHGGRVATLHDMNIVETSIDNIAAAQSYEELGIENPFPFDQ